MENVQQGNTDKFNGALISRRKRKDLLLHEEADNTNYNYKT